MSKRGYTGFDSEEDIAYDRPLKRARRSKRPASVPVAIQWARMEREHVGHLELLVCNIMSKVRDTKVCPKDIRGRYQDVCETFDNIFKAKQILANFDPDEEIVNVECKERFIFDDDYFQASYDTMLGVARRLQHAWKFQEAFAVYQWCWALCVNPLCHQLNIDNDCSNYDTDLFVKRLRYNSQ